VSRASVAPERERRVIWRRHDDDERVQLADDVRRLAGFADAAVEKATRLGAEVPEGVAACPVVWRSWAGRLAEWVRGGEGQ
jgi:hypothetical protein